MRTLNSSRGFGGGPPIFRPVRSYCPLWHAHQMMPFSLLYCTVQSRCVHVAVKALSSFLLVKMRITVLVPNFTILPESSSISESFPAFMLCTATSFCLGGCRYARMGYATEAIQATRLPPRSHFRRSRRSS